MKTPREVLFQYHREVEPKLDSLRKDLISRNRLGVEGEVLNREKTGSLVSRMCMTAWEELVRPSRYIWGGFAAAWLLIFLANGAMKEPTRVTAKNTSADKAMALQTFAEERKLLAELLQAESKPAPVRAEPRPSPRSEGTLLEKRKFA